MVLPRSHRRIQRTTGLEHLLRRTAHRPIKIEFLRRLQLPQHLMDGSPSPRIQLQQLFPHRRRRGELKRLSPRRNSTIERLISDPAITPEVRRLQPRGRAEGRHDAYRVGGNVAAVEPRSRIGRRNPDVAERKLCRFGRSKRSQSSHWTH